MKYDYLIVGAGLYGAVFAREAANAGKSVLVIDKRRKASTFTFTAHTFSTPTTRKYGIM